MLLGAACVGVSWLALRHRKRDDTFLPLFLTGAAGGCLLLSGFPLPEDRQWWDTSKRAAFVAGYAALFGGLNVTGTLLDPLQSGPGKALCLCFSPIVGIAPPAVALLTMASPHDAFVWANGLGWVTLSVSLLYGRASASD